MNFLGIMLIIFIIFLSVTVKAVPENRVFIIERLGKYFETWHAGTHFKMPFIDKIVAAYADVELEVEIVCSDVRLNDSLLYTFKVGVLREISDYYKYTYNQAPQELENLISNELRNICSQWLSYDINYNINDLEEELYKRVCESPTVFNIGLKVNNIRIDIIEKD